MARRTSRFVVQDDNRDKGKVFNLTEMPADQGERWAMRALLALTNAGADLPEDVEGAGMAGLAVMGLQSLMQLKFVDVEPLWDEMFGCVRYLPDPNRPELERAPLSGDIEEISTRLLLRKATLALHVDPSKAGALLTSTQGTAAPDAPAASRITRTSPAPSAS